MIIHKRKFLEANICMKARARSRTRTHTIYIYKIIKDVHVGTALAAEIARMGDHLKTHGVIGNITTCD